MTMINAYDPANADHLPVQQQEMIARRRRLLGPAYRLFYTEPVHVVRGEGVWLYDPEGRAYLDVYNNVASVGHCHPHVVEALCRQLEKDDVVLAVDSRAANEWPQVVRGQCGRVALSTTSELRRDEAALGASVATLAQRVRDGGGRLVLLAADSPEVVQRLAPGPVTLALDTTVREDHRLLERRPDHLVTLPLRVWLGVAPVTSPAG
jgi:hypothetical protein